MFQQKFVAPLERVVADIREYAEGLSTASSQGMKAAETILPNKAQEYLGLKEKPTFADRSLSFFERTFLGQPLLFVMTPLILGLIASAWVHRKIKLNRNAFDKIDVPRNLPPSWLYHPMWTLALTSLGFASWQIYETGGLGEWLALGFGSLTNALILLWPVLFFSFYNDQLFSAICATGISLVTAATTILFFAKSFLAGVLMLPVALCVGYMTVINWQVYSLNKNRMETGAKAGEKGKEAWPWNPPATTTKTTATEEREIKKTR